MDRSNERKGAGSQWSYRAIRRGSLESAVSCLEKRNFFVSWETAKEKNGKIIAV